MPRMYDYETDSDFVVSDDEVEMAESRKTKRPLVQYKQQSSKRRSHSAATNDERLGQSVTGVSPTKPKNSMASDTTLPKASKGIEKMNSARTNKKKSREDALIRELMDLADFNAPPKKRPAGHLTDSSDSERDVLDTNTKKPTKRVKTPPRAESHNQQKPGPRLQYLAHYTPPTRTPAAKSMQPLTSHLKVSRTQLSNASEKTKSAKSGASTHKQALLQELQGLAPYNAAPKKYCDAESEESSESDDEVLLRHRAHDTTSKRDRLSARPRDIKPARKDQCVADRFHVSKKPIPIKASRHKRPKPVEELTGLMIEQKGFCEWQPNLVQGGEAYDYRRSVIDASSQPSKAMDFLELPGELRNHIYEMILEDEKEVTIKKQSSAGGFRRSSRKPRFHSYALAQTCKLLRAEYLPWLRQSRRIQVDLMELYDYLDVFHPAVDKDSPFERAEGHIEPTWHDFAVPKGIDVLRLAKINGASPKLHFYLQPSEAEVRLPEYHELTTMLQILDTFPKWSHLIDDARLQSIKLFSEEDVHSWYKYGRRIEIRCRRAPAGQADSRQHLLTSWVFKSGVYAREDLEVLYETSAATHSWTPCCELDNTRYVKYMIERDEDSKMEYYQLKADAESYLGLSTTRPVKMFS